MAIIIMQITSTTQSPQGKMVLYNPNILQMPSANSLVPNKKIVQTHYRESYKTDVEEKLNELDDNELYTSYFTLKNVMTYDEFTKWNDEVITGAVWCALCEKTTDDDSVEADYKADMLIGFRYESSSSYLGFDEEKYPMLTQFSLAETTGESENWKISEENMRQHIVSMLNYMGEQEEFCKMVGFEGYDSLKDLARNIENEGIYIYGFVSVGTKNDISKVIDTNMIEKIEVSKTK